MRAACSASWRSGPCVKRYLDTVSAGLLKIMSKMGISVISSYRGGYNFEAVGLSRAMVAEIFPGMPTRISGIGLSGIAAKVARLHARAFDDDASRCRSAASTRRAPTARRTPTRRALIHMLQIGVRQRLLRHLSALCRRREGAAAGSAARPAGLPRRPARRSRSRTSRSHHRDPQALRHARHVAGRAVARGARGAQHRDEPDRREVGLRRGRRGPGALQAAAERRQSQLARSSRWPRAASA